jgi:hypothetical protein
MIANRGTIFKSTDGGSSFTVVKDNFNQSLVGMMPLLTGKAITTLI